MELGGSVKNCYNGGNIEGYEKIGGITGLVANANVVIENCYNKGEIKTRNPDRSIAGGIIGWLYSGNPTINNSYNIGNLNLAHKTSTASGAITGNGSTCTTTNCYYLKGTALRPTSGASTHTGVTEADSAFMKSAEFENILNENGTKTNWKRVLGKNNGYPVLTVFNDDAGSNFNILND